MLLLSCAVPGSAEILKLCFPTLGVYIFSSSASDGRAVEPDVRSDASIQGRQRTLQGWYQINPGSLGQHAARGILAAHRVEVLEAEGFIWDAHEHDWNEKFKAFLRYKAETGTCYVPIQHPILGQWLSRQRSYHKHKQLQSKRFNALDREGVMWEEACGPRPN